MLSKPFTLANITHIVVAKPSHARLLALAPLALLSCPRCIAHALGHTCPRHCLCPPFTQPKARVLTRLVAPA